MFARKVSMQLKPDSIAELTRRFEKEIIPLLRKQKGFQDEINFVSPSGTEAFAISLWERTEDAEAYSRAAYPEVVKLLRTFVEGTPRVETFEVSNSTFHKVPAPVASRAR